MLTGAEVLCTLVFEAARVVVADIVFKTEPRTLNSSSSPFFFRFLFVVGAALRVALEVGFEAPVADSFAVRPRHFATGARGSFVVS